MYTIKDEHAREEAKRLSERLESLLPTISEDRSIKEDLDELYKEYHKVAKCQSRRLEDEIEIIFTGEVSAGKSAVLNLLLGQDITPSRFRHCTSAFIRIHRSDSAEIRTDHGQRFTFDIENDEKSTAKDINKKLQELAVAPKSSTEGLCKVVDVYWPFPSPFLQRGIALVDTPGFGETEDIKNRILEYLPKAMAFVYIIDASHAGGVQEDRLQRIIRHLAKWSEDRKMSLMHPARALFVCNKWDLLPSDEDEEGEAEHTWDEINDKLKRTWPDFKESQLVRFSAKTVKANLKEKKECEQLRKLQTMVSGVTNAAADGVLEMTVGWIRKLCVDVQDRVSFKLQNIEKSMEDKKKMEEEFEGRKHQLEHEAFLYQKELKEKLQEGCKQILPSLKQHLEKKHVRKSITEWSASDDPNYDPKKKEHHDQILLEIHQRICSAVSGFEQTCGLFKELDSEMQKELKKRQLDLVKQLNKLQGKGETAASTKDVLSTGHVVAILATTAPIWFPLGLVFGLLSSPVWAFVIARNQLRVGRLQEFSKDFLNNLLEKDADLLMYAEGMMKQTNEKIDLLFREDLQSKLASLTKQYKNLLAATDPDPTAAKLPLRQMREQWDPFYKDVLWFEIRFLKDTGDRTLGGTTKPIGSGTCGTTSQGYVIRGGIKFEVAIKETEDKCSHEGAIFLRTLCHANLMKVFAFHDSRPDQVARIVYELCDCNVLEYLQQTPHMVCADLVEKSLARKAAMKEYKRLVEGIISGLTYLFNNRRVHFNLKLTNILLLQGTVKLTDGWFREESTSISVDFVRITKYVPPEALSQNVCTVQGEIFVLGIILWEIWFGKESFLPTDSYQKIHRAMANIDDTLTASVTQKRYAPTQQLRGVIRQCLNQDPKQRPSLTDVKRIVDKSGLS